VYKFWISKPGVRLICPRTAICCGVLTLSVQCPGAG